MIDVEISIEPPGLPQAEQEPDEPTIAVSAFVRETDETFRSGYALIPADIATDDQVADALIACLRGVAAHRGPGLSAAVERRIR